MNRRLQIFLGIALGALAPVGAAATIVLTQGVLANGGAAASDGTHTVIACAGQLATGPSIEPAHVCRQGFWYHTSQFCSEVVPSGTGVARVLLLEPARPNPSRHSTAFRFVIPARARAVMKLYDVTGREVATLVDTELPAGIHTANLDAGGLPGGVYFCRLEASGSTRTSRLVLLR